MKKKNRASKKSTKSGFGKKSGVGRASQRRTPFLDVSLPVAQIGDGHAVAETFIPRNDSAILDIVLPKSERVEAWCCFGRPAKKMDWTVVTNHPDENGRQVIPVPRTDFYVWGFGRVPSESERGEVVWRVHGHNIGFAGKGRDVCLRLVLRTAPTARGRPAAGRVTSRRVSAAHGKGVAASW